MEAPVVVNPDIVSKKASESFGMYPLSINGKDPKKDKNTQHSVTIINASRLSTFFTVFLLIKYNPNPEAKVIMLVVNRA